jgi:hypothetical protein
VNGQAVHTLFDDPEERVQGLDVVEVADRCHGDSSAAQLVAVWRAKSVKLVGGMPVAFSTSSVGCAPWPVLMVSVSIRSTAPYSAGIPVVSAPAIQASRSRSTCVMVRLAEVLHEPRRSQDGVGETLPAKQVEFDTADGHLRRRRIDAIRAEVGDVPDASGLRPVEEHRHLAGEIGAHERSDQVDPVDALEGGRVGAGLVPIEADVGARAGRRAYRQATCGEVVRDTRAGLAGSAEHQDQRS